MLDILIPIHLPNLRAAKVCVEAVDKTMTQGIPYRILLAVDGMAKQDYGDLEEFMRARVPRRAPTREGGLAPHQLSGTPPSVKTNWEIVDWPGTVYFQGSILNAMARCTSEYVMVLPPWVSLTDPKWFGKIQQPFLFDPHTMLSAIPEPGSPQGTLPPAKFIRRKHPASEGLLTKRVVLRDVAPLMKKVGTPSEWVEEFSRVAEERGGTRWLVPSLRYHIIEHESHEACPEPSKLLEAKSESPSPMTPASSTATTTDPDGFGVSPLF